MTRAEGIISLTNDIKTTWGLTDPFEIARRFGVEVVFRDNAFSGFKAQTFKMSGYPAIISINNAYDERSKKLLCAHELGHALLHEGAVNHFAVTPQNAFSGVEYEANLFAVSLLYDELEEEPSIPVEHMNNYMLKSIIDYNLRME